MPGIPFIKEFKFDYGAAMEVTPLIRRVVARNPNPFTFKGTGTYIIGHGKVAIVDPGPDQQEHIDAVLNAVRGEDSLVRALWAGQPFVWHIYPQDDGAHHAKLDAFLDCGLLCRGFARVGCPACNESRLVAFRCKG